MGGNGRPFHIRGPFKGAQHDAKVLRMATQIAPAMRAANVVNGKSPNIMHGIALTEKNMLYILLYISNARGTPDLSGRFKNAAFRSIAATNLCNAFQTSGAVETISLEGCLKVVDWFWNLYGGKAAKKQATYRNNLSIAKAKARQPEEENAKLKMHRLVYDQVVAEADSSHALQGTVAAMSAKKKMANSAKKNSDEVRKKKLTKAELRTFNKTKSLIKLSGFKAADFHDCDDEVSDDE